MGEFGILIIADRVGPAFAAHARVINAAERCFGMGNHECVHPHHPGMKPFGQRVGLGLAAGEGVSGKTVRRGVGTGDGIVEIAERRNRGNRTKGFFGHDRGAIRHIGQNCRLKEVPAVASFGTPAARHQPRAVTLEFFLCIATLFFLAGIGAPIAYAILVAVLVYMFASGQSIGIAGKILTDGLYQSYILLAVPLFIVAANIMNAGTISDRLLGFCVALVGRFRGGLGHVNVVASLIFSGMSGSAIADAAGIGKIIIGMMVKSGHYSRGYAAAITAASATIGPIIPPSIPMVLYALVSNTSIGHLFLAGIVPGLFMGFVLVTMNWWLSKRRNFAFEEPVPLRELPRRAANAFPALLMPAILLYGIYGGVTTPTEAAAVAAFYALMLAAFFYRALSVRALYEVLVDSARSSAAVGLVIGGALILNYVVASENIPGLLARQLVGLDVDPLLFLLSVTVLLLLLGCVLDATTIILVIIPLFIPACRELGIDLVHFGVVTVVNCMIGLVTPPYGVLLFVITAVTGIPLYEIIREIWPFLCALLLALLCMVLWPGLVLTLPRMLGYAG